jgi:transcriptional regulator with XRE-family HTH domain
MSDAGNPSLDTVELIAERVGVHPSTLFPEPDGESSAPADAEAKGGRKGVATRP